MSIRRFRERLQHLLRIRRPDADLAREIAVHLAQLQERYEARGLAPDEARRAARLAFGGVDQVKELHRDTRSFGWIEDAWRDAGHSLRLLRRSPVFTVTAALSLAVGVGANTAIFTLTNALLFRPPAGVADPSGLVLIGTARGDGGLNPLAYSAYREITRRSTTLTGAYAEELFPHIMGLVSPGIGTAEAVVGQRVTTSFFSTLGATPSLGRTFHDDDESTVVLDHGFWVRRFDGDATVIGRTLRLNGESATIVGVAAPEFQGTGIQRCDLWLAIGRNEARTGSVMAGGRVTPGVSLDTAAAELAAIGKAIDRDNGTADNRQRRLGMLALTRAGANRNLVVGFTVALMALVSLVLAVACANVAGIMLTRATVRAREIALRSALGAGRGRLVRQLLTETTILFVLGCVLGIATAQGLLRLAALMLPSLPTPIAVPLTLDWRVLLFAMSLAISTALVFGVVPALRGSRVDPAAWLKDGMRSTPGRSRLLLVVLAASFVRVLHHAGGASPGFDPDGVAIASLDLSVTGAPTADRATTWQRLAERTRQLRGVKTASLARVPPGGLEGIGLGGVTPADHKGADAFGPAWNIVDTGYFATLRIPLVAGRDFATTDTPGAPPVVIVSRAIAERFWPGVPAVGKGLRLAVFNSRDGHVERLATVIGVAGDIKSSSLVDGLAEPYVYLPLSQSDALGAFDMTSRMSIVVRRRADASVAADLGAVVHAVDPRLVLPRVDSLSDSIAMGLTPQRVLANVGGAMGLVALLLASMGIYGVTAYTVALRRREFAIRLALGARPARVVQMVFRQSAGLVAIGLFVGLPLAVGVGEVLALFFYGLPAAHGPTLVGTVLLFVAIGAAASLVPASQAVRDGWRRALQEE